MRSSNDFRVVVDVVVVVGMAASVEKCVEESSVDSRWSSWVRCKMPMFPSMMTLLMIYPLKKRTHLYKFISTLPCQIVRPRVHLGPVLEFPRFLTSVYSVLSFRPRFDVNSRLLFCPKFSLFSHPRIIFCPIWASIHQERVPVVILQILFEKSKRRMWQL